MATLIIDSERFKQLRAEQGLDTLQSLAAALRVDKATASRVLNGKAAPGPHFISSVLLTFPVKFEDVFTIVTGDEQVSEAAAPLELATAS
ncbi:helix-turn-helix domain-containing protein [Microbacterium oleivorans]|uniref:Helix-turn-helix transcriptional regulator n=1 Tax=Microbacterium oleivorans TaxID=273677 RepID=A0A7D5ERC2_9MICO|nr:helix-turn-helix transcriptional regulator [Microbacterium oleivorans]QLD10925.1 helix-turn-helix transcriptional regulator [Microbacterium oleivorans]